MKRFFLILAILFVAISVEAATLNLRATWQPNTEADMKEYRLYRTDGTRILIGTVLHPLTTMNFSVTVPDNSSGTLAFVLTAADTSNNESADSTPANYPWSSDSTPPQPPGGFIVIEIVNTLKISVPR